ncbi:MAG: class I SAM-dependent methyltransferase [Pseudomonadota bacterium]
MTAGHKEIDAERMRVFGTGVDFSKTAADYAEHRHGFPPAFFDLLGARAWARRRQSAVDLGCGTGTLARGLARLGMNVIGVDPAREMINEARRLDHAAGVNVTYREAKAEATGLASSSVDLVTAGQCWHWFDRKAAARHVRQVLKPNGRVVIAHFDWLPMQGNVAKATERLILSYNPVWAGAGGTGIYPQWLVDLGNAGFQSLETASFDITIPYTHAAWRGRIRASAGVAASLDDAAVRTFDIDLAKILTRDFPTDPLEVPHRVWLATGIAVK